MFLYENKPPAIIAIDLDNMSNQASKIRANSMIRSRREKKFAEARLTCCCLPLDGDEEIARSDA